MSSLVQAVWYRLVSPTCVRMYVESDCDLGGVVWVNTPHLCKNVFQVWLCLGSVVWVDVPHLLCKNVYQVTVVQAAWYGSTFPKMVKEYKAMLIRVQRQHGVERPLAPFTTKDMNDYIDTRRRELHLQLESIGWEGWKGYCKQGAMSVLLTT